MENNALNLINVLIKRLENPFTEEDLKNGWSAESATAAKEYLEKLRTALIDNKELPPLGIVRALDHRGVTGGLLLEDIARLTNKLRN